LGPIDVDKLSDSDIDAILELIEDLVGNPALLNRDRIFLAALAKAIDDRATDLANATLDEQNPAIKELIKEFGDRKDDLKNAHDRLVATTAALNQFAQGVTAFGKLIGVLTAPKK